jgi:diacylglycerol kinase (ATP)
MIERPPFGVRSRTKAFGYAVKGLAYVFRTQHAMWFHSFTASCVVAAGFYLHVTLADWRWLVLAITLVWTAEAMNTAVESVCDALHPDHNKLIGTAKDVAAGSVLVAALGAAIIGALVFVPYIT